MIFKTCKPSLDHIKRLGVSNNCQIRSLLCQFSTRLFLSKQTENSIATELFRYIWFIINKIMVQDTVYVLSISTCLQYPSALVLSCFSIAYFAGETDNFL